MANVAGEPRLGVNGLQRPLAFLCHPYHRGGVTRWMMDAAAAWTSRGQACRFVVPRPRQPFVSGAGRPTLADLLSALPSDRQPTLVAPIVGAEFEFGTEGYRARTYARAVQRAVPQGVPVVVSDDPATWRAVALLRGRNPLIGVLHADDPRYYALARRFRNRASAIVSVSKRVDARAREATGTWRAVSAVIPCGIPLPAPESVAPEAPLHRLVWAGRISDSQKRVRDLPTVAGGLRDAGHDFRFDIIGDGEDATALRTGVEALGLSSRVQFHGWVPGAAVLSMLARSDVMLLPSNFEGMPVAAMEAFALGCAVAGSDTCGLEEYADSPSARDALWIFPCGDVRRAIKAVEEAWSVPRERRREASRRFAEAVFGIEQCMDRYAALLDRLTPDPAAHTHVPTWHGGDVVSRLVAQSRILRVRLNRRVGRHQQLAENVVTLLSS